MPVVGHRRTAAEDAKCAEFEADSPDAAAFEGGFDWGVFAVIVIIVLVAYRVADAENALRSPLESEGESPPPHFR
ncbi:MAG TPA: hypothetical protein VFS19_05540 [Planctomycetota bacterium]|nr:hypothetical protein [Planctomycetota bacterium]